MESSLIETYQQQIVLYMYFLDHSFIVAPWVYDPTDVLLLFHFAGFGAPGENPGRS